VSGNRTLQIVQNYFTFIRNGSNQTHYDYLSLLNDLLSQPTMGEESP